MPTSVPLPLYFLKLGGSLITEKDKPHTPRLPVITRLAKEISAALAERPELRLVIGHGSGSFGHVAASKYGTRQGVQTPAQWQGFVEVWYEARTLNQIVLEAFLAVSLPVVVFPPSSMVTASNGDVLAWDTQPIQVALSHGLIPLIYGDVVFDQQRGGTILSTEELFVDLAKTLKPQRILLAGFEEGVWADFPQRTRVIPLITPASLPRLITQLGGSAHVDVTGGMLQKVKNMLLLIEDNPDLEALIFSGDDPDLLKQALSGASPGTLIRQ